MQASTICDGDLQSIVQMGFNQGGQGLFTHGLHGKLNSSNILLYRHVFINNQINIFYMLFHIRPIVWGVL